MSPFSQVGTIGSGDGSSSITDAVDLTGALGSLTSTVAPFAFILIGLAMLGFIIQFASRLFSQALSDGSPSVSHSTWEDGSDYIPPKTKFPAPATSKSGGIYYSKSSSRRDDDDGFVIADLPVIGALFETAASSDDGGGSSGDDGGGTSND